MAAEAEQQPKADGGGYVFSAAAKEFEPGNPVPYLRNGFFNEELGWWVPYYVGTLKSFNMRTGYGFVESAKTHEIFKADIYIHKSQVPIPFKIGAYVEFAVTQNSRGQPQATDVYWLPLNPKAGAEEQPEQPRPESTSGTSGSSFSAPTRKRCMGTLKSYSKMQGYGFITSEDIADQQSSDVYLDRGQLPPDGRWQLGKAVEFAISYNHKGQPQARDVNWDPVPKLPLATPNAATGVLGGGPLLPASASRGEGQQGLRNLSKIQTLLRSDKSEAVRSALTLQETSEDIDYISFVLERLGEPQAGIKQLTGNAPMLLLLAMSKMLQKSVFATDRAALILAWCEAIIPLLSSSNDADSSNDDTKFSNVLSISQENLQKARAASLDSQVFDVVISKLAEAAKWDGPPGVPAA